MRVLVTGGAGYIGSHVCKAFAQHEPITYDNLSKGHASFVKWGPLITGDLLDREKLLQAMDGVDVVIHMAACSDVRHGSPSDIYRNGVASSFVLFDVMQEVGVKRLLFASSCASKEQANPYGRSKAMVETMARDMGLELSALHIFNAAGADGEVGEKHDPETHLIPLAIEAARTGRPLSLFGNAIRDYVHVCDIARAFRDIAESGVVEVGNGVGYSSREVIEMVERISGMPIEINDYPAHPLDPPKLVASSGKQRGLEEIVHSAWEWHTR